MDRIQAQKTLKNFMIINNYFLIVIIYFMLRKTLFIDIN